MVWSLKLLCSVKTLWPILIMYKSILCNPIVKSLSENIREFAAKDDNNSTAGNVVTLQKEEEHRHTTILPAPNVIQYKGIPDNTLSGSSYTRGLQHYDYSGNFAPNDFNEYPVIPQFGHESYHYHIPEEHHIVLQEHGHGHGHGHHGGHGHHLGFGHRHKHLAYDIVSKAVLWPLAGLALLGTAAALVTNPVLLQLGVVSGKRKRRDTEEIVTGPDHDFKGFNPIDFKKVYTETNKNISNQTVKVKGIKKHVEDRIWRNVGATKEKKKLVKRRVNDAKQKLPEKTATAKVKQVTLDGHRSNFDHDGFVPIPLKMKIN